MNIKMYADLKISENEYKSISVWDIINSYNDAKEQELFKKIISKFKILNLCCDNELITLYITKSEAEYEYIANGKHYRTDVYFEFDKSEPEEYLYKWNGKLCFEIKYSNAVDETKKEDCNKEKLAMVEHQISEVFSNDIKEISDKKSYYETLADLKNKLSKIIFIKILSNPSPPAYNELLLYNQKNIELSKENDKLKSELISLKTKYDIILNNKLIKLLIKAFGIE